MKRSRRPGYELTEWGVRPVDKWREWASVPIPSFKLSSSVRPPGLKGKFDPIYTVEENGVIVGTWRHSDVPWLSEWLARRQAQLHGAWHIAREQLAMVEGQKRAGKDRGSKLKEKATLTDAKLLKIAREIDLSDGPMSRTELADRVATRTGRGRYAMRTKLATLWRK